jgi:AraC family transcriptional regulator
LKSNDDSSNRNLRREETNRYAFNDEFSDYKIGKLWGEFMPRRSEITHALNQDLISMAVYPATHFSNFNPHNSFDRWAAVEVSQFDNVPSGMETTVPPTG